MTDQSAQLRDEALSVLRDVLEWSLTPAGWEAVTGTLDSLGTGLDLADPDQLAALNEATIALELAGPVRITRIDKSAVPAPDGVRDRVNQLIHELTRPERSDGADGYSEAGR